MDEINEMIMQYLLETLNYLDGRGLVVENDELIKENLKTFFPFKTLKNIIMYGENTDE